MSSRTHPKIRAMRNFNTMRRIGTVTLFALGSFFVPKYTAEASVMSSTNFQIQADSINVGGLKSTSGSYAAQDTLGEPASGENMASALYIGCAGYQCFQGAPYMSFTVTTGLSAPGTAGVPIDLGQLSTSSVTTSNGTTVRSVFITAETNATHGIIVTVRDANTGLARTSAPTAKVNSATTTLTTGLAGFGLCVFSSSQGPLSPSSFAAQSPYASTCDKTTGHQIGGVSPSNQNILLASGALSQGASEILVKASRSVTSPAGGDFTDTLTFIATSEY